MARTKAQQDAYNKTRSRKKEIERNKTKREVAAEMASFGVEEKPPEDAKFAEMQAELRLLEKRTKGNPTDEDGDIDFAYRYMASLTVTPLMAPSTAAWSWYIYARTDPNKFLEICAKRADAKAKMAGTITNQRMEDDKRQQFAVIERLKKELTLDVEGIITELMQKFPGDVRRVVAKFDVPAEPI